MDSKYRIRLYRNGNSFNDGKLINLPNSMEELLSIASKKINVAASRVFSYDGAEIEEIDVIRDNDVLFISAGEPFVKPTYEPVENLSENVVGKSIAEKLDGLGKKMTDLIESFNKNMTDVTENNKLLIDRLQKNALTRLHNKAQFDRMYVGTISKKPCSESILKTKFKEFQESKKDLEVIENKIKPVRNKKGHPLDSLNEVSLDELNENLKVLCNLKEHIISKNDIDTINTLALYAGVKAIKKQTCTMCHDFYFYHTCSNY